MKWTIRTRCRPFGRVLDVIGDSQRHRGFGATAGSGSAAGYDSTLSNVKIGPHTRVIFQGFTGRQATINAKESLEWGTNIVGGVTPGRTGEHLGLPVLPTVQEAVRVLRPDATGVYVAAHQAAAAIEEAIEAEIPLIVAVAEHIPLHDLLRIHAMLKTQSKCRLVGANTPGIISAVGRCRIGFQPLPFFQPGRVGIAAKSGTLSYEAVASTTRSGLGQSLCIGVGGDLVAGTDLREALAVLAEDADTDAIIMIGEIGGSGELEAAEWIKAYNARERHPKPIAALVAGERAPPGRIMGHAGAFTSLEEPSVGEKRRALKEAGATLVHHPQDFGLALVRRLDGARSTTSSSSSSSSSTFARMRLMHGQKQYYHSNSARGRPSTSRPKSLPCLSTRLVPPQKRSLYLSGSQSLELLRSRGIRVAPQGHHNHNHNHSAAGCYLAIGIDRTGRCPLLVVSPSVLNGAADGATRRFPLTYGTGTSTGTGMLANLDLGSVAAAARLPRSSDGSLRALVEALSDVFCRHEAYLAEVCVKEEEEEEEQGRLGVTSAAFGFDDAAYRSCKRQGDMQALRDASRPTNAAEVEAEVEAEQHGITYIRLPGPGRIGTLVIGAGLAMNTVDMLAAQGGTVANFLDTGGKATSETVRHSFAAVLADARVRVVLVNIFGGLTRGDMVARGVVLAFRELRPAVPVVVRIRGTSEREGQAIVAESGLPLFAFDDFYEAAGKAIELSNR